MWLTVSELSWLADSGVVVLNSCSATMHGLRIFLWSIGLVKLLRPPTASQVILGTGVQWVSTRTHPCGSPSRQDDGETRAPALHTLDDVLRFRGDEEYRAVLLQKTKKKHHARLPAQEPTSSVQSFTCFVWKSVWILVDTLSLVSCSVSLPRRNTKYRVLSL